MPVPGTQMMPGPIAYRADIDGLRALAVLSVLVFHISPGLMPGGFLGVDIFFVISGYLISQILYREQEQGQFSFRRFFLRRVRRLFPALALVLVAVLCFGYFALFAGEYQRLARHILASIVFLLNFRLMEEVGYFDVSSEFKPVLHLWSLSVEEQFYLFWPVVLIFAKKLKASIPWLLMGLFALSFLWAINLSSRHQEKFYFDSVARFWEFILGAALAWWHARKVGSAGSYQDSCDPKRTLLQWLGLLLIVVPLFAFNKAQPFLGLLTIVPLVGVMLIIGTTGPVSSWLSAKPLVFLGLISYPLYLWHWPIISFNRIITSGNPPAILQWGGALLSVLLAWMTWRWVEQPLRQKWSNVKAVSILFGAMGLMFMSAFVVVKMEGFRGRTSLQYANAAEKATQRPAHENAACIEYLGREHAPYYCRLDPPFDRLIAVIGDSHADAVFSGVAMAAASRGYGALLLANSGCPPLDGTLSGAEPERTDCLKRTEQVLRPIENDPRIRDVVIVSRGPIYISGSGYGPAEASYAAPPIQLSDQMDLTEPVQSFVIGLERTANRLINSGKRVHYLLQVPELGIPALDCMGRPIVLPGGGHCLITYSQYAIRMREYREAVIQLGKRQPHIRIIDPEPLFCDHAYCTGKKGGNLLYADDDHLSAFGANLVGARVMEALDVQTDYSTDI